MNTIMKKTYIIPQTQIRFIELEGLVAVSLQMGEGEISDANDVFVKGESSNTQDVYNVWDDDWSK